MLGAIAAHEEDLAPLVVAQLLTVVEMKLRYSAAPRCLLEHALPVMQQKRYADINANIKIESTTYSFRALFQHLIVALGQVYSASHMQ